MLKKCDEISWKRLVFQDPTKRMPKRVIKPMWAAFFSFFLNPVYFRALSTLLELLKLITATLSAPSLILFGSLKKATENQFNTSIFLHQFVKHRKD